jgi:hypothetical protein
LDFKPVTSEIKLVENGYSDNVDTNYLTSAWDNIPLSTSFDFNTFISIAYLKNIFKSIRLDKKRRIEEQENKFAYVDFILLKDGLTGSDY